MNLFDSTREKLTRILLLRPEEEMYADVLDLLREVFESEFGYFGYINREGHLVCPSMTRHIFPQCQVADKDIHADNAELLDQALTLHGHITCIAHDGLSAIEQAQHFAPDVALLDIGLPVIDGYEVARRMSAMLGDRTPMLVAITGYGQSSDRERSRQSGFHSHLVKPVQLEKLCEVIASAPKKRS